MTHGSLFSGIGGFDLAASWMGWENVFHCEWNEFGQRVLKYYWPESISYGDITKTDFTIHRGQIDVLSGGFPCQPFSVAGKRKGTEDNRHLWPEMLRAIREIQPVWVVGENVSGLLSWSGGLVFEQVCTDLEAEGYEVQPVILPAVSVNAPHRRDRVWFVAKNTNQNGRGSNEREKKSGIGQFGNVGTGDNERLRTNYEKTPASDSGHIRSEIGQIDTMGLEQLRNERTTSDSSSGPKRSPGASGEIKGIGSKNYAIKKSGGIKTNQHTGCCNVLQPTSDSLGVGMEGNRTTQQQQPQTQTGQRLSGCNNAGDYWREWPTQSPLRGRNDGISSGLAGITVSKHRNESIKAYGNAVVPQVVYQIFKCIEQTKTHLLTHRSGLTKG